MAHLKKINLLGAVIGRWIHLHLPSFDPGFDPRAKNLCILYLNLKSGEKETRRGPGWPIFVIEKPITIT